MKKFHSGRKDKYQWQSSVYAYTFTFQQKEDAEAARKAYSSGMDINALKKYMPTTVLQTVEDTKQVNYWE